MKTLFIFLFCLVINARLPAQWTGNVSPNLLVSNKPGYNLFSLSVPSGDGGSIVVFSHQTEDEMGFLKPTVVAQKINKNGTLAWGSPDNPVVVDGQVSDSWDYETRIAIAADGTGGVFIAWAEAPSTGTVWIQHLNAAGEDTWAAGGLLVSDLPGEMYAPRLCLLADDHGGVFISWNTRSATIGPRKMYVRRYDASGNALWTKQPTVSATSKTGEIVSDAAGGVIAFFNDSRNDGIFAQRLDPDGIYKWADDGVTVCTAPGQHYLSTVDGPNGLSRRDVINHAIPDGHGGAIVMFNDDRNSSDTTVYGQVYETNIDVYAQHVDANGNLVWDSAGVPIANRLTHANDECYKVLSDGNGGAIVRTGSIAPWTEGAKVLLQRIDASGQRAWGDSGIVLTKGWDEYYCSIRGDDKGNTYVGSFYKELNQFNMVLEARKINVNGEDAWPGGVFLGRNIFYTDYSIGLTPVEGGAILCWTQSDPNVSIHANKIVADGTLAKKVFITLAAGNWDDSATWQSGEVPPAGADVVINHAIIVNVDVSCHSLQVQNGGSVKVDAGIKLDIMEQ